jgi:hypothetical protein
MKVQIASVMHQFGPGVLSLAAFCSKHPGVHLLDILLSLNSTVKSVLSINNRLLTMSLGFLFFRVFILLLWAFGAYISVL